MARRLSGFVHLHDENGVVCSYGPDDTVPAWAARQITNPAAWADAGDETSSVPAESETEAPAEPHADEPGSAPAGDPGGDGAEALAAVPPPKGGAGSGRDAWAEYASAMGFDVDEDDSREVIIAGLEEVGIATEAAEPE